eukprot:TRINITY_DN3990_c5_g1_i2.p1 TRINITY_DN3990_c5_g1~~TRINITY_DN3990_c5_g1_i2.p1  ORF type:complete len:108 (-),score=25.19 TRINITY_DN3990_c5_g1_i2:29-352(-)
MFVHNYAIQDIIIDEDVEDYPELNDAEQQINQLINPEIVQEDPDIVEQRLQLIIDILLKHRLDYSMEGDVVKVLDANIQHPYRKQDIYCENPIVLGKLQRLICFDKF